MEPEIPEKPIPAQRLKKSNISEKPIPAPRLKKVIFLKDQFQLREFS